MAKQKYPYNPERVKKIFEDNPDPSAHQKLREYLETEVFPSRPNMSKKEKKERGQAINLARTSVWTWLNKRGVIKSHHRADVHAVAWPEEKKEKFIKYFRTRGDNTLFTDETFKDDFTNVPKTTATIHNFARDVGVTQEDRAARREALRAKRATNLAATASVPQWWEALEKSDSERYKKFQTEFLDRYRSDYRVPGSANEDLLKEWPEAQTVEGFKSAARFLGEVRSRPEIVHGYKIIAQVGKDLEKRIEELVKSGALAKSGEQKIYDDLRAEFSDKLEGLNFTKRSFITHAWKIVFVTSVDREIKRAIRNRRPLDDFYHQYFSYIPEKWWNKRVKFHKGLWKSHISATFVAGVGRLITDELGPNAERFEFPVNDYHHPVEISADTDWSIPIINGAHIGIIYDPNIEDNPLRRALSDSRKRKAATVVLTNLIDLYVKKTAGVGHIYRAPVSGLHVKLEHLPESYREEAARIMRDRPNDEVVYQNIAARFLGILEALDKICHRPKKKGPEFPGRVLYALGYKEEELINEAANSELRYINTLKQNQLRAEMKIVNNRIAQAEREGDFIELSRWEMRQQELSEQLALTILTNVSDDDRKRQRLRLRALFVKKVQEVIPNCTVISQGGFYLKVGRKIIKLHIPCKADVNDSTLSSYDYGMEVFTDTLADITVICHPHALNHRFVGREDSKDGQPVTKFIHVAPLCLDDVFLREQLRDTNKEVHPIQKCVNIPQFRPGVLLVNCTDGLVSADPLPIPKLDRFVAPKDSRIFVFPYPKVEYINGFLNSDNHIGAPDRREIWDPKNRMHLGTTEAAIEMMRREGMMNANDIPIHFTAEMDDASNGDMWFAPRYRPDPQEMSVVHIARWLRQMTADIERAAEQGDNSAVKQMAEEINRVSIEQIYFQGEDFPFHQMEQVYDRHIDPNVDFYSAVLGRFVKSGLAIRGISKINQAMMDKRDLGVHNFPNGNHRIKTMDQKDLEGDHMARHLQEKLMQLREWQNHAKAYPEFLHNMVRAPRFGNQTFGWGTIKAPGRFEWGMCVHGSPARQSSWTDILGAQVRSDLFRGDDTYGLKKFITIVFFGDKHFYAKAETARMFYVMCAAGVHNNQYGSSGGFPPNNTGPCFVSIPADGPDAGPIIVRALPHDVIRDWFAKPRSLNWSKILPLPV